MGQNSQRQTIEHDVGLGISEVVTGADHVVSEKAIGGFSVSVFIERDSADTDVDVDVQGRKGPDPSVWRSIEITNVAVTGAAPANRFDKVYETTTPQMRVVVTNRTVEPLAETEIVVIEKSAK